MLLIERLIGALSPEEIKTIKAVKLTPVEHRVLDTIILSHENSEIKSKSEKIRTSLRMSQNNLRFYSSSLLRKSYTALVPEGGLTLLRFLASRGLLHNFKNEVRIQEKTLGRSSPKDFYFATLELSIGMNHFDAVTSRYLGDQYLRTLTNSSATDSIAVELRIKQAEFIYRFTTGRQRLRTMREYRQYLDDIALKVNGDEHRYCNFAFADAEYNYQYIVNPLSENVTELLKRMAEIMPAEMEMLLPETREILEFRLLQQAEHTGDAEFVWQVIDDFFVVDRNKMPPRNHLLHAYYAILTGRFNRAEELLQAIAPRILTKIPSINTISYYMMLSSLFMLTGDLSKARKALDDAGQAYLVISRNGIYEIYFRNLELIYHGLIGDCDFCLRLIERNLDWLRKGKHDIQDGWATTFQLTIRDIINAHTVGQPITDRVLQRCNRYKKTGPDGLLLQFIDRLKNVCERQSRSS